jgi:intracellular septation protein
VDYGPLALFLLAYLTAGLMAATAIIIAASLAAAALAWLVERRLPIMPLVTAAVVAVFGGLTLWLRDETFIKMKPTIVQVLFGTVLLFALATGRPLLKSLFGSMIPAMNEQGWRQLTLRYALFFFAMALLNELVWRTQSTDVWVSFKVFGILGLTVVFIMAQMPLIQRHMAAQPAESGAGNPER